MLGHTSPKNKGTLLHNEMKTHIITSKGGFKKQEPNFYP